ncbi:LysM peptidoglycan-binding domain-containing protein [Arthrobacter agilis]|uniref:LysM peptidoglycan-binding domain-containing protein n=1 Tax=Arthrobacter agilis TaxID=37921 RepID=UPI000B35B6B5|nr:LysM domain-containing protein [Arthrobacter agilis]OUM43650.1 hypothetical protein B8W74_05685 [Arthrobacter agilis]PPB46764.1 LysM peptidoglycan-binding domain-containing protein [Arthrobacter agilis]TPV24895.1 LysM peptidoglycan-binding domain-containing protein [Arthrobacter agilis]VDR31057.1 LysM domain [Arthrobacter agilis]
MSRNISTARHRADVDGNLALQGLSRAAKSGATSVGRPVAIAAVTSGLALSAVGTAHAGTYTAEGTAAPAAVAPAAASGAAHTVVAGDTLGAISASYGADLTAVLAANGLTLASVIFPGDTIVIPAAGAAVAAPVQTVSVPVAVAPVAPAVAAAPVYEQAPAFEQAAAIAPAPAVSAAPTSGIYLASATITPVAETPAPSGNAAAILLGSAQAQLAAGAVQDCTVLVEKALRAAGFSVGDLGPSQFFQFGTTVATPAPGDIVITGGHVAIYAGGGQVISSGMNGANLTMQHPLSDLPGASFVRVG